MKLISSLKPVGSLWALATCFVLLLVLDQCETMLNVSKLSAVRAGTLIRKKCVLPSPCKECVPGFCSDIDNICTSAGGVSGSQNPNLNMGRCGGLTNQNCVDGQAVCGYTVVPVCYRNVNDPLNQCWADCVILFSPPPTGCPGS